MTEAGETVADRVQCEWCGTWWPLEQTHVESLPGADLMFCPHCVTDDHAREEADHD